MVSNKALTDKQVQALIDKGEAAPVETSPKKSEGYTDAEVQAMLKEEEAAPVGIRDKYEEFMKKGPSGVAEAALDGIGWLGKKYGDHALDPILTFIKGLPEGDLKKAVKEAGSAAVEPGQQTTGADVAEAYGVPEMVEYDFQPGSPAAQLTQDDPTTKVKIPARNLVGTAVELTADIPALGGLGMLTKAARRARPDKAGEAGRKVLKALGRETETANVAKMIEKTDPGDIGAALIGTGLIKKIKDPDKFMAALAGTKKTVKYKSMGGHMVPSKTVYKGGLIDKNFKEIDQIIKKDASVIDRDELAKMLIEKHRSRTPLHETVHQATPREVERYGEFINDKFGIVHPASSKREGLDIADIIEESKKQRGFTLHDINELKKQFGQEVRDQAFKIGPDAKLARDVEVKRQIWFDLRDFIQEKLGALDESSKLTQFTMKKYGVDAQTAYDQLNRKGHYLMSIRDAMEKIPAKELLKPGWREKMLRLAGEAAASIGVGSFYGAGAGVGVFAGLRLLRRPLESAAKLVPYRRAVKAERQVLGGQKLPALAMMGLLGGSAAHKRSKFTGESRPQALGEIGMLGIPDQLIKAKLPRSTAEIIQNQDVFIAKLAQETDDPEVVEAAKAAVQDPSRLPSFLKSLSVTRPGLFVDDKYQRFDGEFTNIDLKRIYIEDLRVMPIDGYLMSEIVDHIGRYNSVPKEMGLP